MLGVEFDRVNDVSEDVSVVNVLGVGICDWTRLAGDIRESGDRLAG